MVDFISSCHHLEMIDNTGTSINSILGKIGPYK